MHYFNYFFFFKIIINAYVDLKMQADNIFNIHYA